MGVNGIYGLSGSGLDIESLVKMGMMTKQNQYDKMQQKETYNTWLKEAYVGVYNDVKTFKSDMSDFKMQSNMNAMKASSTDSNVVSATANGAAAAMSHKVTVNKVASNAYMMTGMDGSSPATITRNGESSTSTSTKLTDVIYKNIEQVENADGSYSYNITRADGTTETVNGSDKAISIKLQDSNAESNKDADGNYITYEVSYTFDQLYNDGKTLSDLASAVGNSGANIQGNYDSTNDSFSLYNKTSGETNIIGISAANDDSATLLNNLHLASYDTQSNTLTNLSDFDSSGTQQTTAGTNAEAIIDGKTYTLDTNVKTVAGVTYTFNDISKTGETTTVNVSQDTDTIVSNVKKFVEIYNTLLDSLNDKLSEEKNSDYDPLSDSQKAEMTEDQITKWEEKAKSGLLYNNSTIRSLVSEMRESIYTPVQSVDSQYNSLSAIGITTSTTKGHIELDEDKLTTALAADPDCVYQLFASDQDSSYIAGSTNTKKLSSYEKKVDYQNTGVANRLYNIMGTYMDTLEDYGGTSTSTDDESYLGKLITSMQEKMSNFKTLMESYQDKLYEKYDAMEVALSNLGTQLSYISSSSS